MIVTRRQGDILFIRIDLDQVLTDVVERKTGVIAEGERTGHAHKVKGWAENCGVSLLEPSQNTGRAEGPPDADAFCDLFLVVGTEAPARIEHEEHADIVLEPDTAWRIRLQRQYHPKGIGHVED